MVKSRVQRNMVTHEHIVEDTDALFQELVLLIVYKYNFRFIYHAVFVTSRYLADIVVH